MVFPGTDWSFQALTATGWMNHASPTNKFAKYAFLVTFVPKKNFIDQTMMKSAEMAQNMLSRDFGPAAINALIKRLNPPKSCLFSFQLIVY